MRGSHLCLGVGVCVLLTSSVAFGQSRPTPPVVGGELATADEVFSTVVIGDLFDGEVEPFCTGTLITKRVVVTATHCVVEIDERTDEVLGVYDPSIMRVGISVLDAYEASADSFLKVERIVHHTGFPNPDGATGDPTGLGRENDIALLILEQEAFGVEVAPILPPELVEEVMTPGRDVIVTGYGLTDSNDQDSAGVLNIGVTPVQKLGEWEFHAGRPGEVDTCEGDSGGPVYVVYEGVRYLVGASSRAVENDADACGSGGLYTLVPAFIDWIEQGAGGGFAFEPVFPGDGGGDQNAGVPDDNSADNSSDNSSDNSFDDSDDDFEEEPPRRKLNSGCGVVPVERPGGLLALVVLALIGVVARRR